MNDIIIQQKGYPDGGEFATTVEIGFERDFINIGNDYEAVYIHVSKIDEAIDAINQLRP